MIFIKIHIKRSSKDTFHRWKLRVIKPKSEKPNFMNILPWKSTFSYFLSLYICVRYSLFGQNCRKYQFHYPLPFEQGEWGHFQPPCPFKIFLCTYVVYVHACSLKGSGIARFPFRFKYASKKWAWTTLFYHTLGVLQKRHYILTPFGRTCKKKKTSFQSKKA